MPLTWIGRPFHAAIRRATANQLAVQDLKRPVPNSGYMTATDIEAFLCYHFFNTFPQNRHTTIHALGLLLHASLSKLRELRPSGKQNHRWWVAKAPWWIRKNTSLSSLRFCRSLQLNIQRNKMICLTQMQRLAIDYLLCLYQAEMNSWDPLSMSMFWWLRSTKPFLHYEYTQLLEKCSFSIPSWVSASSWPTRTNIEINHIGVQCHCFRGLPLFGYTPLLHVFTWNDFIC